MHVSSNLRGIACMVLASGTFVANDSFMKLVLADTPPLQVLLMRGIAATLSDKDMADLAAYYATASAHAASK